jgi:hypothetical protein
MNQKHFNDLLSSMPPLRHNPTPDAPFDYDKSEPLNWLMAQPGFKAWLWERIRNTERIEYRDGVWVGVRRGPVGRPSKDPDVVSLD